MTNKKILPTLLKVNIITLVSVFVNVIAYNVYLAVKIRDYDRVSTAIHDYADLANITMTKINKLKTATEGKAKTETIKEIIDNENELNLRIKKREEFFLKIYEKEVYDKFIADLLILREIHKYIDQEDKNKLLDQVEESLISIFMFSKEHNTRVDEFFVSRTQIMAAVFILIVSLVIYILLRKIKSIIAPLREITTISEDLSISDSNEPLAFADKYEYFEYQILANTLTDMHKRIHYENRMSSHESASESIGHFAENLAHSINNPLAIIATSIKILGKVAKRQNNSLMMAETEQVLAEVSRITDITHQMKSLINSSSKSEPEYFKANNLITTINLLFFNRLFEKGVQVFYEKDLELNLFGREDIIGQIVTILIENSIQYNDAESPKIEIIFEDLKDEYIIHIRDNGSSPDPEFIEGKMKGDDNSGSLGLYTAYVSAMEHDYKLEYFCAPIKDFVVTIPKDQSAKKNVS